jgi:hypothetical protein
MAKRPKNNFVQVYLRTQWWIFKNAKKSLLPECCEIMDEFPSGLRMIVYTTFFAIWLAAKVAGKARRGG